jgi:hypothetical protein
VNKILFEVRLGCTVQVEKKLRTSEHIFLAYREVVLHSFANFRVRLKYKNTSPGRPLVHRSIKIFRRLEQVLESYRMLLMELKGIKKLLPSQYFCEENK